MTWIKIEGEYADVSDRFFSDIQILEVICYGTVSFVKCTQGDNNKPFLFSMESSDLSSKMRDAKIDKLIL